MKKVRRLLATICTLALAVTLGVGSMGSFAFAAADGSNTDAEYSLNVTVATSVEYGESFEVPSAEGYTVTVTGPNGKAATVSGNKVTANQLGTYTVEYAKGDASYAYTVKCELNDSYSLYIGEVANNVLYTTADIPSYVEKGTSAYIPAASLGHVVDGVIELTKEVEPVLTGVATETAADGKVTFNTEGTVFVTYETTVGNGSKVVSTVKQISVQSSVGDDAAPVMTVTNFPKTGQLNAKVTLPKASVTDNYDSAASVKITVKDPNGADVVAATVDEKTGYAIESNAGETLYFDNDNSRTYTAGNEKCYSGLYFYPTVAGDYKVTYQATDDAGNKSEVSEYTVTVSDSKAPTVSYDASSIPSNWGWKAVYKLDTAEGAAEDALVELDSNAITFGMPEFYDNVSAKADMTVSFALTDPEGKTVVRFANINSDTVESYTPNNSAFGNNKPTYTFDTANDQFVFDIKAYVEGIKGNIEDATTNPDYAVTGEYTAYYTVKDAKGNTVSTSNYYINVVETYEDKVAPSVSFDKVPDRVVLKENTEFTVPTVSCYSSEDSKLAVSYLIKSGSESIEVESGDVIEYVDGLLGELSVTDKLTLEVTATSDAGNTFTKTVDIDVVKSDSKDVTYDVAVTKNANAELKVGVGEINYGTVVIGTVEKEDVKNVGVELGVKNAAGEYLNNFSAEIYWANNTKIVRNITFTPTAAGTYYLVVRVFDVYGANNVRMYPIEITEKSASGSIESGASAGTLATSAEIYTTVELVNKSFVLNNVGDYFDEATFADNYYCATAHVISGGRFSLMGEELVMMTTGTYRVTDKPVIVTKADYTVDYEGDDEYKAWINSYAVEKKSISATQSSTVTFEVVDKAVPTYVAATNTAVTLPAMTAYTAYGSASEIKVDVEHSSGSTVKATENEDGTWTFTPNSQGTYTVTYTAVVGGTSDSVNYTIKVGDVTAPTFTVEAHELTANVGDKFEFKEISEVKDASTGGFTYLKSLTKDGSTVATVKTRTGKGEDLTFTESGTYEVKYEVTDAYGNTSFKTFTITVTEESVTTVSTISVISWILAGVGVLLIAGIVVYLIVSRKKKTK